MVGRSLSGELYSAAGNERQPRAYGEKVLSIQNLSMGTVVRNTSFSVFAGQITGLFGLVGSGRTETMKIVGGVLKRDFFHGGTHPLLRETGALSHAAAGGAATASST